MDKNLRKLVSLKNPMHFLGLGFGSGLIPFMPGTFGSLAAIPLLLLTSHFSITVYVIITAVVCLAGITICGQTSKALKSHDHGSIVWDEIAGMMITFIALPINLYTLIIGFLLFRFFDILKPWPIRFFDKKIHGGLGIMLDDIVAGGIACGLMHIALIFL